MKKSVVAFLTLSSVCGYLLADEASDQKALEIRKAQAALKAKAKKADSIKEEMQTLNDDFVNSSVIDDETLKVGSSATKLMTEVSDVRLKKTNEELLKAGSSIGANRKEALKSSQTELKSALSDLEKIRKLAALKADKAKIQSKLSDAVEGLKSVSDKIKSELNKELKGEKPDQEKLNDLAEEEKKLSDQLKQIAEDVKEASKQAENPEDKKDLNKVDAALNDKKPEENAAKKANDVADKIEQKDLADALKKQQELIDKLQKAATDLADSKEKDNEPMTPEEQLAQDLENLSEETEQQNKDLADIKENNEGDENLQQKKEFNDALQKQNQLKKALQKAKEQAKGNPEAKKDLEKAEDALDQAQKELDENDLQEAMEQNEKAQEKMQDAMKKLDKDGKMAKKNQKKNKGKGKEEPEDEKEQEAKEPEMEEVKEFVESEGKNDKPRDFSKVELRDNKLQLGEMPTSQAVWGNKAGEKDKKVLMQSVREKAPKEYDELTGQYFEALASLGE